MSRFFVFSLVVSGLCATLFMAVGCDAEIQHGLEERQANRIVTVLREAGIRAEKVKEKGRRLRFTVRVPSKQAARAFRILKAHELPPRSKKGVPELFGKSGLVPTATEEHMKKVHATGSEIARTLEQMEGVLSARVHLVIPPNRGLVGLGEKKDKPRGSVFIKVRPGSSPASVAEVQNLVAGAVAGLNAQAVSVIIRPGPRLSFKKPPPDAGVPTWFKAVAAGACVVTLLLAALLVWLALRLKKTREQLETVEAEFRGSTGSSARYEP